MKKRMLFLVLLVALCGLSSAQAEYIMTEDEMYAVWQESFDKMNTTGALDIRTLDDLPGFEQRYTADTGRERKDDLVFESLPMEGDMPYEEALAYARKLIIDKFGVPEAELDAMGVYPRLVDHIYADRESEWEFYFTPRRDTDIHLDHTYDAPGEYRTTFGAQTGTVDYVNWYIDAFFPDYAQRTWDAGKYEYVYSRAKRRDFFHQSMEKQAHFIELFRQAGYDVSELERTDAELLSAMSTELAFAEPSENLLFSADPAVHTALAALEQQTGLTKEILDRCAYAALPSPMQRGTNDICFSYNYNIESGRYDTGGLGSYEGRLFSYVSRLGLFMVKLDPVTGKALDVIHAPRSKQAVQALDETLLLGRLEWTAADLPEWEDALRRLRALDELAANSAQPDYMQLEAEAHTIMREIGGDPEIYNARAEAESDIGLDAAKEIAWKAVCEMSGLTLDQAQAEYGCDGSYSNSGTYMVWFFHSEPDGYFVSVDAATGEVLHCSYDESAGNG